MARVVRGTPRTPTEIAEAFAPFGVATAHEAQGRTGLLSIRIVARQEGVAISGTALTCEVPPGDNWMIHVAIEQARPGDILVVAPTSPCEDGYFGDLLATSAMAAGIRGIVIDAGVRDIATLRRMGFAVWSRAISAQGTVKETLADVQVPLVCGGALVAPGDVVIADDDGVCIVRRADAETVLAATRDRARLEEEKRLLYASGTLSLDATPALRQRLHEKGLVVESA